MATEINERWSYSGLLVSAFHIPLVSSVKNKKCLYNTTEFIITVLSVQLHLSTALTTDLVSTVDRHNTQWEGPLGRDRGGSEHWGIQAERKHFGNSRNLHNNEGEGGGCSDPGEPAQVPQEKEEEVSHTVILEKEQEKERWEGQNRSLRGFTVLLGRHLKCLVNFQLDEGN